MKALREQFPNHESQVVRLAKIEGQIKGIRKMIEERRYCMDIVQQIKAVTSGLRQVEMGVLETHIHHCVRDAVASGESDKLVDQVDEIVSVISRMR